MYPRVLGSSVLVHNCRVQSILFDPAASGSVVTLPWQESVAKAAHIVRHEVERKRIQEEARAKY